MKIIIFVIIITVTQLCNVFCVEKQPKLSFIGKRIINIGNVKAGTIVKHTFEIQNSGNSPLVIIDIGKSCNCTSSKVSKHILQPSEKGNVFVEIKPVGGINLE